MRYGIIGPRDYKGWLYDNADNISRRLASLPDFSEMVNGGGNGVEQLAAEWAATMKIPCQVIAPDFKANKNQAYIIRNQEIILKCHTLVAFWDAQNPHILSAIEMCLGRSKHCILLPLE